MVHCEFCAEQFERVSQLRDHDCQPHYDRGVLIAVLTYHWRNGIGGCGCGWNELGKSFPEHVAAAYEHAAR